MKAIKPSASYAIAVPDDVHEAVDSQVTSLWVDGQPLLLQVSSYLRTEGAQIGAGDRLSTRVGMHGGPWTTWADRVHPDPHIDQATAERVDQHGVLWIHTYLVWPHLAIYVLLSGPDAKLREPGSWPRQAVESIALVTH